MGQPDANGSLIPGYIQEGSVVFSNPKGRARWMTVAVCGALYNPRKATCEEACTECDGYSAFAVVENPYSVAVNGTVQLYAQATYPDGTVDDFTTSSSWSSSNTAVATVGASTGLVTGVSGGSAEITALMPSVVAYNGDLCGQNGEPLPCPQANPDPEASGSVTGPPAYVIFTGSTTLTGLCTPPATGQGVARSYAAYDSNYNLLPMSLTWTLHEIVTSSSSCGMSTDGTEISPNFVDSIYNCQANCTFTSTQWFSIVYQGLTYTPTAEDCVNCTPHTGWKVTATNTPPYVTVTDY